MEQELWADVVGYEGLYKVSSWGRIRSRRKILATFKVHGYPSVNLCGLDGRKRTTVHLVVARAFLGPAPDGYDVSHEDGSRDNNRVSNLKYRTRKDNIALAKVHGTCLLGERANTAKLTAENVRHIRERCIARDPCHGYTALANELGVTTSAVRNAYIGKTWRHI